MAVSRTRYQYHFNFLSLPEDLRVDILTLLSLDSLLTMTLVCKRLKKDADTNSIWLKLLKLYSPAAAIKNPILAKNGKEIFVLDYKCRKYFKDYLIYPINYNPRASNGWVANLERNEPYIVHQLFNIRDNNNYNWANYWIAKSLINFGRRTNVNLRLYIQQLKESENPNAMFLEYESVNFTVRRHANKALLLEAHQKGSHNATMALALQVDMWTNNLNLYISAVIEYVELLILAANRGSADAAFMLAKQYERQIDLIINSFTLQRFQNARIPPCTEKEWKDYREMKDNAVRAMSDKHFQLDRTYKLHFSAKNYMSALNARSEKVEYWYQKARERGIYEAKLNLFAFKQRNLQAEVKQKSIYRLGSSVI